MSEVLSSESRHEILNSKKRKAMADVVALLKLKKINDHTFEGPMTETKNHRIYGGQVVSQALMAAMATVENRPAISLKSDFLRAGNPKQTVIYNVENVRDGRSFNTRRVVATQEKNGEQQIIFTLSASFHEPEEGVFHQMDVSHFPKPHEVSSSSENWIKIKDKLPDHAKQWYDSERAFEERPVIFNDPTDPQKRKPLYAIWYKANDSLPSGKPEDEFLHQGLFAYISDSCLLDTCLMPHGISWMQANFQSASLDHSIWFHKNFRVDEWLLFVCDSPIAYGARGFNRAMVYRENGELIASVAQEGLIRIKN